MTDTEIIKALECCKAVNGQCSECSYRGNRTCIGILHKDVLDLINRQKAEIEELRADYNYLFETMPHMKTEAIKEFAERLKEKAYPDGAVSIAQELVVDVRDIDDLVEEMTVNYESSKNDKQRKEDGKNV